MDILYSQLLQVIVETSSEHFSLFSSILAQTIEDPDILGQIQDAWSNFLESGQAWALAIGAFLGYTFKGFTG
ncbi:hypothetical protein [Myxosarcina sp. GI1(2024)]